MRLKTINLLTSVCNSQPYIVVSNIHIHTHTKKKLKTQTLYKQKRLHITEGKSNSSYKKGSRFFFQKKNIDTNKKQLFEALSSGKKWRVWWVIIFISYREVIKLFFLVAIVSFCSMMLMFSYFCSINGKFM